MICERGASGRKKNRQRGDIRIKFSNVVPPYFQSFNSSCQVIYRLSVIMYRLRYSYCLVLIRCLVYCDHSLDWSMPTSVNEEGNEVGEKRHEVKETETKTYLEERKFRLSAVMNLPLFLIPSFRQLNSMKVRYIAYQD